MSRIFILLFFFQLSFGQEKSIQEYKRIAYEIINRPFCNFDYSVFIFFVENNLADSRTMDHFKLESDFTLYFGTTIY